MADREIVSIGEQWKCLEYRAVHSSGTERTSDDSNDDSIEREPERLSRPIAVNETVDREYLGADWVTCQHRPGKVRLGEGNRARFGEPPCKPIRRTRSRVLFSDDYRNTPKNGPERAGHTRVTAERDNHGRTSAADDSDPLHAGADKTPHRAEIVTSKPPLDAASR
jgi:hypothetical protein